MVNLTVLAQRAGVKASDWYKTKESIEFMMTWREVHNRPSEQGVITSDGLDSGVVLTGSGILVHPDIAAEFSRWVSPIFSIKFNKEIETRIYKPISIKDFAKMVSLNNNLDMGEKSMFEFLRVKGILKRGSNRPSQIATSKGWFKYRTFKLSSGLLSKKVTPLITQKGVDDIMRLILESLTS